LLAPDFYLPLRELGTHFHARAEAVGAAEEILKILSIPPSVALSGSISWVKTDSIHIQYQDVHLAFEGGRRPALKGISFDLKAGEHVALVGKSGAGKSTTLNLLLGFLQPDKGRILVNETLLAVLTPESWRKQVTWIGQNPVLFYGTIKENILMGRTGASDSEVNRAARSARVLDFSMNLDEGLNTLIGEQGLGLSRGQAQRVALARAFLKDTSVLLLDEPTAGLDTENERLVIKALEKLTQGRTVLLLTHRLNNIQQADRILELENGLIVEQGTYEELMSRGGAFYRLANRKSGGRNHAEAMA
jgi:ATP-binding cassette subfamily C protein CydD